MINTGKTVFLTLDRLLIESNMRILFIKYSLILFILFAVTNTFAQKIKPNHKLLWKIEGKNLQKPSYLFGTMHVKDERVFNLSDSVFIGISNTEVFASEIDMDNVIPEMFELLFKKDSIQKAKKILTSDEYKMLDKKVKDKVGVGLDNLNTDETWTLDFFVDDYEYDVAKSQRETFLDAYLFDLAKKLKKKTIGLEYLSDYSKLSDQSNLEADYKNLIDQTERQSSRREFRDVVGMYEEGDLGKIERFRRTFNEDFAHDILIRNATMAQRMDSILQTQSMFVAMGCAHLPGDSGMIDLLRKKGYKLTPVTAIYTGIEKKYRFNTVEYNWRPYSPKDAPFEANAPGRMFYVPMSVDEEVDMKMHLYPDIYRDVVFMILTMTPGRITLPDQEEEMLNRMADGFLNNEGWELITKRIEKIDGKKKLYIILKDGTEYYQYVVMIKGAQVVMGAATGNKKSIDDQNVRKFLESIRFSGSFKEELDKEVSIITDSTGAYQASMPLKTKESIDNSSEDKIETRMRHNLLPMDKNIFTSAYYLYKDGSYIENDSTALLQFMTNIKNASNGGEMKSKEFLLFKEKYNALKFTLIENGSAFSKTLLIARGNRLYLFMVEGTEESIENNSSKEFFESINFIDYNYDKERELYYEEDGSFNFAYYDYYPTVDSGNTYSYRANYYKNVISYSFNDKENSCAYGINRYKISPYFSIDNPRKFMDSISMLNLDTLTEKPGEITKEDTKSMITTEFIVKNKDNKYRRMKYLFTNNELYEVGVYSVEEDLKSEKVNDFMNSITLTPQPKKIYADKGKKLLEDLMSRDTVLRDEAKNAIGIVRFSKAHLPLFEKALLKDYKEGVDYYYKRVNNMLLEAMQRSFPKEYPNIAKNLYLKYNDNVVLQNTILGSLSDHEEDSLCFYTYISLLKNNFPSKLTLDYYYLSDFGNSKYAPELIEAYCSLLSTPVSRSAFIQAMGDVNADSLGKVEQQVAKYISTIEDCLSKYVFPAIQRKDTAESYYPIQVMDFIDLFPKERKEKWLTFFLEDKDDYVQFYAIVKLLKNNNNVDPKLIRTFFADVRYRYELYSEIKKKDRLSLLTEKELTSKNIAEAYLAYCLNYEDETLSKVEAVSQKEVFYKGKKRTAYLLKYKYTSDKHYYGGICIPEILDQKNDDENESYWYSNYEYFNSKSQEKDFNEMLKNLEEE
jgi:uncharacterized protein YbaP (TraB family)